MEIDVTAFVETAEPFCFSASVAERGKNAGRQTWDNAVEEASARPLLNTIDQIEAVRRWFGMIGDWDDDECAAWSDDEVNALLIQYISGDLREAPSGDGPGGIDWDEYVRLQEACECSSNLFMGDDNRIYCRLY